MNRLIVANFKTKSNKNFFINLKNKLVRIKVDAKIILCPSFVYLPLFENSHFDLASQNIANGSNNLTGEITAPMLKDFGVKYVLVGHNDRAQLNETDISFNQKIKYAINNKINPILIVGDDENLDVTKAKKQIINKLNSILTGVNLTNIIIAYEPSGNVGKNQKINENKIELILNLIKNYFENKNIKCKILYGGNVNLTNFKKILNIGFDGLLVGRACQNADVFIKLIKGVES